MDNAPGPALTGPSVNEPSWHDSDAFWEVMEAALFSPARLSVAAADIDAAIRLLKLTEGAHVLDMCTGPGRHAIELARRGFRVTGVDRTRRYLERARLYADQAGVSVEFVEGDMRRFVRPSAFDIAINMYTSFGYFLDERENTQAARNLARSLRPGGTALFELVGREVVAATFRERWWEELEDGICLEERKIAADWEWIESRWILIRGGKKQEFQLKHWLYSGSELRKLLLDAGFADVRLYGALDGRPYDRDAKRLVAVAQTPSRAG